MAGLRDQFVPVGSGPYFRGYCGEHESDYRGVTQLAGALIGKPVVPSSYTQFSNILQVLHIILILVHAIGSVSMKKVSMFGPLSYPLGLYHWPTRGFEVVKTLVLAHQLFRFSI
jgi:hypothetical protein